MSGFSWSFHQSSPSENISAKIFVTKKNPKEDLYTTTIIYSSEITGTGTEPQKGNQNKGRSQMLHTHLQTKKKEPRKKKNL
jgi:hypothetical protein